MTAIANTVALMKNARCVTGKGRVAVEDDALTV